MDALSGSVNKTEMKGLTEDNRADNLRLKWHKQRHNTDIWGRRVRVGRGGSRGEGWFEWGGVVGVGSMSTSNRSMNCRSIH